MTLLSFLRLPQLFIKFIPPFLCFILQVFAFILQISKYDVVQLLPSIFSIFISFNWPLHFKY